MKAIRRAIWGRWLIVAISVAACLVGGLTVIVTSPPRYKGTARVVLDYIRPDPATGAVLPSKMLDAYITTQIGLIRPETMLAALCQNPELSRLAREMEEKTIQIVDETR